MEGMVGPSEGEPFNWGMHFASESAPDGQGMLHGLGDALLPPPISLSALAAVDLLDPPMMPDEMMAAVMVGATPMSHTEAMMMMPLLPPQALNDVQRAVMVGQTYTLTQLALTA